MQIRSCCGATSRELEREPCLAASPRSHDGDEARGAEGSFEFLKLT
jgi:hypothetical protein